VFDRGKLRSVVTRNMGRAIAQAVSRRLPIAAARVQTRVWSCGIFVMDKSGAGVGFVRELRFPLPIYIPSASPQSSSLSPEARSGRSANSLTNQIKKIPMLISFYDPL
jgi:hypothetical protein